MQWARSGMVSYSYECNAKLIYILVASVYAMVIFQISLYASVKAVSLFFVLVMYEKEEPCSIV